LLFNISIIVRCSDETVKSQNCFGGKFCLYFQGGESIICLLIVSFMALLLDMENVCKRVLYCLIPGCYESFASNTLLPENPRRAEKTCAEVLSSDKGCSDGRVEKAL
jgi:hypothetical protein